VTATVLSKEEAIETLRARYGGGVASCTRVPYTAEMPVPVPRAALATFDPGGAEVY